MVLEDNKIVQLYISRNEDAIKYTEEKYGSRIRKISYGITADYQTSEECENDTYMEAWNRIPPNNPADYFYAFLIRIVRNISIDCCRKKSALKRESYIVTMSEELENCIPGINNVDETLNSKYIGEAINRYLHTISIEKRVIFIRRYFYLDSISEIAARMNLSESKVKTTIFRTRNNLRNYLKKEEFTL